ncbi:hypothetical protein BJV82DRAFT_643173 [Fennellomyces sp. T-0311]|nr:hypothetical protein BJV82DRAFT_643173 [Fennellomyces sp. T-0311]
MISELLLNLIVLIPAAIFCSTITYLLTLYNSHLGDGLYRNGAAVIASLAFFVCVFGVSYYRVKYPRLFLAALQSMPLPFFCFTRDIYVTQFDVMLPAGIVYPLIIGCGVALVVNLCLWPETAAKASETSLGNMFIALRQALAQYSAEETVSHDKLKIATDAMQKAQREAKYEIVISNYRPAWYKPLTHSMERLANHIYGMSLALERAQRIMVRHQVQHELYDSERTLVEKPAYKHISRLHASITPTTQEFLSTCIRALEQLQHTMAQQRAIPASFMGPQTGHVSLQETLEELHRRVLITLHDEFEHEAPMEEHFLVYTILYTLTAFGKDMVQLEKHVDELLQKKKSKWTVFWPQISLRQWLSRPPSGNRTPEEQVMLDQRAKEFEEIEKKVLSQVPLQHRPGRHFWNRWLYRLSKFLQYGPTRYALKFTVTAELLALMAWLPIPGINHIYDNNHGQWALLSAMVVSNVTIGATALQCFFRIVATVIGAVCGYIVLLAAHRNENPYALAVVVFVFQMPMWYVHLGTRYPRIGMISLLTMAVIVSAGFTDLFDETLIEPLWKRILTAVVAVLVVMGIEQIFWPTWARKLLVRHLSQLLIDTGIQYAEVTSLVCQDNILSPSYISSSSKICQSQRELERQCAMTKQMLGLAASEARPTKAPFPIKEYGQILELEKRVLYWIQHVYEAQIVAPTAAYRQEMASTVHLYLFTLAGSLCTRTSLPAKMPTAELARQMLHQHHLTNWQSKYRDLEPDRANFEALMYWHACAAGTVEIILLQESMAETVATLMGQHIFPRRDVYLE